MQYSQLISYRSGLKAFTLCCEPNWSNINGYTKTDNSQNIFDLSTSVVAMGICWGGKSGISLLGNWV